MDNDPVIVEQVYDTPRAVVWKALTDKEQLPQWFFDTLIDFKPEVGFATRFNVECDGKDYLHLLKVSEVAPLSRVAYGWRFDSYPGDSTVAWDLSDEGAGTRLVLTHTVHEPFRGDPLFSRENGVAGWTYFLQESLMDFLEKTAE